MSSRLFVGNWSEIWLPVSHVLGIHRCCLGSVKSLIGAYGLLWIVPRDPTLLIKLVLTIDMLCM